MPDLFLLWLFLQLLAVSTSLASSIEFTNFDYCNSADNVYFSKEHQCFNVPLQRYNASYSSLSYYISGTTTYVITFFKYESCQVKDYRNDTLNMLYGANSCDFAYYTVNQSMYYHLCCC